MNIEKRIKELEEEQLDFCCTVQEGACLTERQEKRFDWVRRRLGYLYSKIYCSKCGGKLPREGSPFTHVCSKEV